MRLQLREPLRRAPLARRRAQIQKFAAADGALRRGVAQHEAVAGRRRDRPLEHELHRRFAAGRDRRVAKQHDAGADFGRGMMQARRHPLRHRLLLGGEQSQAGVDAVGRRMQVGIEHDLAAGDGVLADAVAGKIERAALSGDAALGRPVLRVQRAHPRNQPRRTDRHAIAGRDRARQHGAGHHGAGAGQGERTIDREPETLRRRPRPDGVRGVEQLLAQCVDAVAGHGRDRNDLGALQAGALQELRDVGQNFRLLLRRGEIDLGERDDAAGDAEQIDDGEMLAGLRHDAVVGGDHQQHEIDAGGAGQHVVDEFLVPRHVDEAEHGAVRRRQIGEAEIDGNAARLFFLEPVGIDAGQRAHQRGLAVIDVAGGSDDHGAGSGKGAAARRSASAICSGVSAERTA